MDSYNEELGPSDLEYMRQIMGDEDMTAVVSGLGLRPSDVQAKDDGNAPGCDTDGQLSYAALEDPFEVRSEDPVAVHPASQAGEPDTQLGGDGARVDPLNGPRKVPLSTGDHPALARPAAPERPAEQASHAIDPCRAPAPSRAEGQEFNEKAMLIYLGRKALARRVLDARAGASQSDLLLADGLVAYIEIPLISRFSVSVVGDDRIWNAAEKRQMVMARKDLLGRLESEWRRRHSSWRGILRWLLGKQCERPDSEYYRREARKLMTKAG